jgi:uncharacterized membrane protein
MNAAKRRDLEERFAALEERVFRIELRLGPDAGTGPLAEAPAALNTPAAQLSPQPAGPVTEPMPAQQANVPPQPVPPTRAEQLHAGSPMTLNFVAAPVVHATPPPLPRQPFPASAPAPRPVQIQYATPAPEAPVAQGKLERAIGLKWAGWIGAIVLMAGAAFGVKYIYDQHWFAAVPAIVWLCAIIAGGLALLGVGEVIYRRVHVIPAASVFGAGIATLFLAGYVGNVYYQLYAPGTALFLMATAALIGAMVAMRGNLVSIAVLSHLGVNVAPLLVGSHSAPLESFLIYLLAMQMVSLTLASWGKGKKWWTLRGLSLATTSAWVAGTGLGIGDETLVLTFSAIYAAMYHGELIVSAHRKRDDGTTTVGGSDGVTFALLVTAALAGVVLWTTRMQPAEARGAILLAMSALFAGLGWILLKPGSDYSGAIARISVAHRISGCALLALAVPTFFNGLGLDIGWGLLAVALAAAGAITRSRIARIGSVAIWLLGLVHLAISQALPPELGGHAALPWYSLAGVVITRETLLACGFSIVGQVVAAFYIGRDSLKPGPVDPRSILRKIRVAQAVSVLATIAWAATALNALPPLAATAWIVEYAWLLVAFEAIVPQLGFSVHAAALLIFGSAKWAIVDTLMARMHPGWSASEYRPIFNPEMGIGTLLSASILTLGAIRPRAIAKVIGRANDSGGSSNIAAGLLAGSLLLLGISFETDRIIQLMQAAGTLRWPPLQALQLSLTSIASLLISAGLVVMHLRDKEGAASQRARMMLVVLLGLVTVHYLVFDTTAWRLIGTPAQVPVIANLECATGLILASSAIVLLLTTAHMQARLQSLVFLLVAITLLWTISIEIDRWYCSNGPVGVGSRPEQVALSILWASYALGSVVIGFRLRAEALRYFGLALLAVTLLKVVLIDMSQVQTGYRILSFMGLGVLMLGTSVLYGKFGARLLGEEGEGR